MSRNYGQKVMQVVLIPRDDIKECTFDYIIFNDGHKRVKGEKFQGSDKSWYILERIENPKSTWNYLSCLCEKI